MKQDRQKLAFFMPFALLLDYLRPIRALKDNPLAFSSRRTIGGMAVSLLLVTLAYKSECRKPKMGERSDRAAGLDDKGIFE
jgi:hypothetical protein